MEFKLLLVLTVLYHILLKVLSYWNLNLNEDNEIVDLELLKVLSYWNLNIISPNFSAVIPSLKVLSYWNLNFLYLHKE